MLNWDVDSLGKMRDELLKQAEKDHLAQEVIEDMHKSNPHYNPTLAWVGRRIMNVGVKLVQMSGGKDDRQSAYKPNIHSN
jgi:hypothetical protein